MLCANLVASPPRRRHGVRTKFLLGTDLALALGNAGQTIRLTATVFGP